MDNQLNYNAVMAWMDFGMQNYSALEQHGQAVYNYFVHHPKAILSLDNPLLIGKVFHACLGFKEPDEDIQEVRAENAFICFSQALNSDKANVHDEASARLMMLLIGEQKHLKNKVEHACQNEHANPYSMFGMLSDGLPMDMPMATNTKMLFTAYYLYNGIINKENVINEFAISHEKNNFVYVKNHILDNCRQLDNSTSQRKIELGKIVFDKINERLIKDINLYANSI